MTSHHHESDSFFDSDDDDVATLKGEYNRGSSPESQPATSPKAKHTPKVYSRPSSSGHYSDESDTMSRKKDSAGSYDSYSRSRSRSSSPSYRRSRSPSYTRSRSRSQDYSDSFNSEDSGQDSRRASPVRTKTKKTTGNKRFSSGTSKDSRSTFRSYGTNYTKASKVKKGPTKKGGMGRSQSTSTLQQSPRSSQVAQRMLSAKGHTISRLRSEVDELRRKYDDAVRENKLMKQLQRRQETALAKFEDRDEELPTLLRNHAAEVDNLRERLRRTQDREKDKDRRLKDKNEELNRLNDELSKLRKIADDKHLLDRDKLQRKFDKMYDSNSAKERRVDELERHLDNLKKNQRHDSDIFRQKEKELRVKVVQLEDHNQTLQFQLREKEKELDIRNIYSIRTTKPNPRLNTTISPTPTKPQPPAAQTRAVSNDEIKKKEKPAPHPPLKRSSSMEEKAAKKEASPRAAKPAPPAPSPPKKELEEHEKILMDLDFGLKKPKPPAGSKQDDVLSQLDEGIKKRERIDQESRRAEERRRREEKKREEEEEERRRRREEDEARRRKTDEEERRKAEEERKEKERRRKEEEVAAPVKSSTFVTGSGAPKTPTFDDNDGDSEEDNIPFFGSKPKAAAAPKPAVNSVRDLHRISNSRVASGSSNDSERRQEEEDHAAQRRKQKEEAEKLAEERRRKDALLAKMKEIDQKPADTRQGSSKKEYRFTQPIENLHNGKPSHPDLLDSPGTKKKPAPEADAAFGSYAPSFGRRAAAGDKPPPNKGGLFDNDDDDEDFFSPPKPKPSENSNLLSNLFGDTKPDNKNKKSLEGTVFSTSTKAKPVADSTALPWEKKPGATSGFLGQQNKPNGFTVNVPKSSFDDFDDDIEEVIL